VLNSEQGLVLTDRNTVPVDIADVTVNIGNTLIIPARVVYLHPILNIAVLQYNPALLGDTPIQSIRLAPPPPPVRSIPSSHLYILI
jgi:hypothetical protein